MSVGASPSRLCRAYAAGIRGLEALGRDIMLSGVLVPSKGLPAEQKVAAVITSQDISEVAKTVRREQRRRAMANPSLGYVARGTRTTKASTVTFADSPRLFGDPSDLGDEAPPTELLADRVRELEAVLRDLRSAHQPDDGEWLCPENAGEACEMCLDGGAHEGKVCYTCSDYDNNMAIWPCPVARAIDAMLPKVRAEWDELEARR